MATWFNKLMHRFGYTETKHVNKLALRKYQAAQSSILNSSWTRTNLSADSEIRNDLEALRARARDLVINNDFARKFLQMVETNIVGPNGFTLQCQSESAPGKPDFLDNKALEAAFLDWGRPENCDVGGRFSFVDMQGLIVKALGRDGEALVRRVRNKGFKYGYKLQVLDIDRLDVKYNQTDTNGAQIRMGVELDETGAPVAYWLTTRHPGDYQYGGPGNYRERVLAKDIFHLYRADRPEQRRGVTWLHTAMISMQNLAGYQEAAIIAARVGATKMGFFVSPDGSAPPIGDETDADGNFITDAEPGRFDVLPEGYDFRQYNPDYPQANFDSFMKTCLRGIAAGLGVAYNGLSNDLENVNFSSIRAGVLEERENWMVLQNWFISAFMRPVFNDWLELALLKGAIIASNGAPLPAYKLGKYQAHTWMGRRWDWIDPQKDIDAKITAIRAGLIDPQTVASQSGLNLEDVIARLQTANKLATDAGLPAYCNTQGTEPAINNNINNANGE